MGEKKKPLSDCPSPESYLTQGDSDSESTSVSSSMQSSISSATSSLDQESSNVKGGTKTKKVLKRSNSKKLGTFGSFISSRRRSQSRLSQSSIKLSDDGSITPPDHSSIELSDESSNYVQKSTPKFTRTGSLRSVKIFKNKSKNKKKSSLKSNKSTTDTHSEISEESHYPKATFSSILKDSKFPEQLKHQSSPMEPEEVLPVAKFCPYQHCSLHGHHHHHHEPPATRFPYLKRRTTNDQNTLKKTENGSADKKPGKKREPKVNKRVSEGKNEVDFSIEFYAKTRSEPVENHGHDEYGMADILFGVNSLHEKKNETPIIENRDLSDLNEKNDGNLNGSKIVVEKKPALKKSNQMSMWHMIHRHMVSGLEAESGDKIVQQVEDNKPSISPKDFDDATSQEMEIRKMFAIKLVREAIEKILLPEVQDDQSTTSEVILEQDLSEKDKKEESPAPLVENQTKTEIVENQTKTEIMGNQTRTEVMVEESRTVVVEEGTRTEMVENQTKTEIVENQTKTEIMGNQTRTEVMEEESRTVVVEEGTRTEMMENQTKTEVMEEGTKTEAHVESKIEKQAPKSWSRLKKVFLLRKFVKELEKVKKFNPKKPTHLPLPPQRELETVSLRRQKTGDKKNADEWMLDYALQKVVGELAPTQKRKVALLVKAFETVAPAQDDIQESEVNRELTRVDSNTDFEINSPPKLNPDFETNSPSNVVMDSFSEKNESVSDVEKEKRLKMWHMIYQHVVTDIATKIGSDLLLDGEDSVNSEEKNLQEVEDHTERNYRLAFTQSDAFKLVKESVDEILLPDIPDTSSQFSDQEELSEKKEIEPENMKNNPVLDENKKPAIEGGSLTFANRLQNQKSKNWDKLKKLILLKRSMKALEGFRKLKPQTTQREVTISDREKEKVDLRRQMMDERKKAEQWMLDYAVQHIVTKLTPARKQRVFMLVEAFEAIVPLPEI